MSLPFAALPHRLRPADVFPVQLANRLGERLVDARSLFARQHRGDDPNGGVHELIGQPIASRLYAAPASGDEWGVAPPVWSYGPWDGSAKWAELDTVNFGPPIIGLPIDFDFEIVLKFANPLDGFGYRGRAFVEMNLGAVEERALVYGAAWHPTRNEFQFRIPGSIMKGARLICLQVF